MQRFSALISVAIFGFGFGAARADDAARPLDDDFLIKAASCGHAQIEIGKLAEKHAASAQVKEFAAQAVKDHQKCYDKLADVVKNRNVAIVSGLEKETKDEMDRLSKLQGAEFDREYLNYVITSHKKGIECCEAQAKEGKNAEIRTFASETIPTMREHLKRAEGLAKEVK